MSFLNLDFFTPYKILENILKLLNSILFRGWERKTGRVIFEINKLLTIVIFPYGVRFLAFHRDIYFWISLILFSIFVSVISSSLSALYVIPSETNSCVQSNINILHKFVPLSLHLPIFMTFVFSLLILRPLIISNSFRADISITYQSGWFPTLKLPIPRWKSAVSYAIFPLSRTKTRT